MPDLATLAPRIILPPPTIMASSAPVDETVSAISVASRPIKVGSTPYSRSPANCSPESLRRTRGLRLSGRIGIHSISERVVSLGFCPESFDGEAEAVRERHFGLPAKFAPNL